MNARNLHRLITLMLIWIGCGVSVGGERLEHQCEPDESGESQPNILFISVDDLNDWVGCLGGNPQTITPNIDRLAASGVLFTNAHCPGVACNPSRTAVMTGIAPNESGLYRNDQTMRLVMPSARLLPRHLSDHGYHSAGSGKLLHYFIDAPSWDDYFPRKEDENPFPFTLYPDERPVSLPRGGAWQYIETDWGPLDVSDEQFGGDWSVASWVAEQLSQSHSKPFFLACGIYRPHEPWFVPQAYFDRFPLEDIELPLGYLEDDLDDLPPAGRRLGPNRYFAHIREHEQWKSAIQGYLASIHFADAMIGKVVDALEQGPNASNTIVVLWSDHGWHLGEKQHWQKYTAWRAVTRVPLIVRVPAGAPGLPAGTIAGSVCDRPVNLLSLFPTICELSGVPNLEAAKGPSLVSLLNDADASWNHPSITYLGEPNAFGLSEDRYRYIRYANGDEELYDIQADPFEWTNLAVVDGYQATLVEMRERAPKAFAPLAMADTSALPALAWHAVADEAFPGSEPTGPRFHVLFRNASQGPVELRWLDPTGVPTQTAYASIEPGGEYRQLTRQGAAWLLSSPSGRPLGYFRIAEGPSLATIPAER